MSLSALCWLLDRSVWPSVRVLMAFLENFEITLSNPDSKTIDLDCESTSRLISDLPPVWTTQINDSVKVSLLQLVNRLNAYQYRNVEDPPLVSKLFIYGIIRLLKQSELDEDLAKFINNAVSLKKHHFGFAKDLVERCIHHFGFDYTVEIVYKWTHIYRKETENYVGLSAGVARVLLRAIANIDPSEPFMQTYDRVTQLFERDIFKKVNLYDNERAFNFLAQLCASKGENTDFILQEMTERNIPLIPKTVRNMIDTGTDESASNHVDELINSAYAGYQSVSSKNLHLIISGLCERGSISDAVRCLTAQIAAPEMRTFHMVLQSCLDTANIEEADKVYKFMRNYFLVKLGHERVDTRSLIYVTHTAIAAKNRELTKQYLKEIIELDLSKEELSRLFSHIYLADSADVDNVEILCEMLDIFVLPESKTQRDQIQNALIQRSAEFRRFDRLADRIKKFGPTMNWTFDYKTIESCLQVYKKTGNAVHAIHCLNVIRNTAAVREDVKFTPIKVPKILPRSLFAPRTLFWSRKYNDSEFRKILKISYDAVIEACANAGTIYLLDLVVAQMISDGIKLNTRKYNLLIHAYGSNGRPNDARMLYIQMTNDPTAEPDIYTYGSLVNALVVGAKNTYNEKDRRDHLAMAFQIPSVMRLRGHKPDLLLYNVLMYAHAHMGSKGGISKILAEMKRDGINPDIFSFHALLAKLTSVDAASIEELLKAMRENNVPRDEFTYNLLIKSCMPTLDMKQAETWLERMQIERDGLLKKEEILPDIVTYTTLMQIAFGLDDEISAFSWFFEMKMKGETDPRCAPNELTYLAIVHYYTEKIQNTGDLKWWNGCEVWFERMMEDLKSTKAPKFRAKGNQIWQRKIDEDDFSQRVFGLMVRFAPSLEVSLRYWNLMINDYHIMPSAIQYSGLLNSALRDSTSFGNEDELVAFGMTLFRKLLYEGMFGKSGRSFEQSGFISRVPMPSFAKEMQSGVFSRIFPDRGSTGSSDLVGLNNSASSTVLDVFGLNNRVDLLNMVWVELHFVNFPVAENDYNSMAEAYLRNGLFVEGVAIILGERVVEYEKDGGIGIQQVKHLDNKFWSRAMFTKKINCSAKTINILKNGLAYSPAKSASSKNVVEKLEITVEKWSASVSEFMKFE